MPPQNIPTPASEWAVQDEVVDLPSGKSARLRKNLSLKGLVRRGVLDPEAFVALIEGKLDDPKKALETEAHMVCEMFVEPRVVLGKAKASELVYDLLADEDIAFVVDRAFGGTSEAASFRGDGGGADSGADSADVLEDPERDGGDDAGNVGGVPAGQKPRRKAPKSA